MKKFLLSILLISYLATSSGATLTMHYCMGKLVSWKWLNNNGHNEICGKCGMKKERGIKSQCCSEEYKTVKLTESQNTTDHFIKNIQAPIAIHLERGNDVLTMTYKSMVACSSLSHAPPEWRSPDLLIFNCTFRI